eukprot:TRINITY_DN13635_c0_g1_i1.p1 TRINITY_DN13635_c0_g1~~TRINITY_DN13635_c0_g1_i1.p1  ORF type:complete len:664 (+),score=215.55 TRINITY_DN13635_c0_g1_i1:130-1992(+)
MGETIDNTLKDLKVEEMFNEMKNNFFKESSLNNKNFVDENISNNSNENQQSKYGESRSEFKNEIIRENESNTIPDSHLVKNEIQKNEQIIQDIKIKQEKLEDTIFPYQPQSNDQIHQPTPIKIISNELENKQDNTPKIKKQKFEEEQKPKIDITYKTSEPNTQDKKQRLHKSRERDVPSTQLGRVASFGGLFFKLGAGALGELTKQTLGFGSSSYGSVFITEKNAEHLVSTLCRMRGAALKLGQVLSLQDEGMLPKELADIFERVRQGADFMSPKQLHKVLEEELGEGWRDKVKHFDDTPIAAASIGQVHRVTLHDGTQAVMKVQYPGVAESIESDVKNLGNILNWTNLIPKGMYLDTSLNVAKEELSLECNYLLESQNQMTFRSLLKDDPFFNVPKTFPELTTRRVLTSEYVEGTSIEKITDLSQEERNHIASKIMELCLKELFSWRMMQTDPNWANFFYDRKAKKVHLLDFGSCREFGTNFIDEYINVVHAASQKDRNAVYLGSVKMGFLTGDETQVMKDAHVDSVMVLGEPFCQEEGYNFGEQKITTKIRKLIPTMIEHRLTPPPPETYSLHRKLAGCFLISSKLKAVMSLRKIFYDLHGKYWETRKQQMILEKNKK